jgi:biotin carboxyl carrier protein
MRWKLKLEEQGGVDFDVEFRGTKNGRYFFSVNNEVIELSAPQAYPFSIQCEEMHLHLETWTKTLWKGSSPSRTFKLYRQIAESTAAGAQSEIRTQMPGRVLKIFAKAGETVKKGQSLLVLEAMKMENEIRAERDGQIESIEVSEGQSLESGTLLARLQ